MRAVESDICIIGSGITAAMVAARLSAERRARIVVVEAGAEQPPPARFFDLRRRYLDHGESPWPNDHIDGLAADGMQSRSMCVGGMAMHWGGVTPRFSPEDFQTRSACGVGTDWPITYEDLDPAYQAAEELMGVAGEQGPSALDPRAQPFPLPMIPLSYNLERLKGWTDSAGIATWSQPSAKLTRASGNRGACCRSDTCFPICPVGAKYSPDMTWRTLRDRSDFELVPMTLVRRLRTSATGARIEAAEAVDRRTGRTVEFRAGTFVVASGYMWSPTLLLWSASSRYPNGLANSSGLVGKYLCGHRNVQAFIELPMRLFPGINAQHSLLSKQFMRVPEGARYIRHDLRVWESAVGREPRLAADGNLLLGDEILRDWRERTNASTARVRAYYDVLPDRESSVTLDAGRHTPWGDPMPVLAWRDDPVSRDTRGVTEEHIRNLFSRLAAAGGGRVMRSGVDNFQDHPGGGCRMGSDPSTSVVDSHGRAHDHDNLFVVGAPTMVSASCANGTLTMCALALRSAAEIGRNLPSRS
ncbi:MAG: GMC oxidoreductase [Gemmatimonadota bacterium]